MCQKRAFIQSEALYAKRQILEFVRFSSLFLCLNLNPLFSCIRSLFVEGQIIFILQEENVEKVFHKRCLKRYNEIFFLFISCTRLTSQFVPLTRNTIIFLPNFFIQFTFSLLYYERELEGNFYFVN